MPDDPLITDNLNFYLANAAGLALPEPMSADEAARQIVALYEQSGYSGVTLSLRFGDMREEPLYSVSVYPDLGLVSSGAAVKGYVLKSFIEGNLGLLNDPRCGVGLWHDVSTDTLYYDLVALVPGRQEAIALAQQYNQIAIYDLGASTEIAVGGTGEGPPKMPPAAERLPNINLSAENSRAEEEL